MAMEGDLDRLLAAVRAAGIAGSYFQSDESDALPAVPGAYLLFMRLDRSATVKLGGRAPVRLKPGWLVYAGSARGSGGIRARLGRHLRAAKRRHWHVDQLTVRAAETAGLPVAGGRECNLIDRLLQDPSFVVATPGFGSSDCRHCRSHLLRYRD